MLRPLARTFVAIIGLTCIAFAYGQGARSPVQKPDPELPLEVMLDRLGYEGTLDEMEQAYCEFHHLDRTRGEFGSEVRAHIESRHCLVPDHANRQEAIFPTSCRRIGHYIAWNSWPGADEMGLTKDEFLQGLRLGWKYHNEAIDVYHYYEPDHTKARVRIRFERLSGSTVAWSYLADGKCGWNYEQRYDIRDWRTFDRNNPIRGLGQVVCHEDGHLVGLGHDSSSCSCVMSPWINLAITGWTQRDLDRLYRAGYKQGPLEDDDSDNDDEEPRQRLSFEITKPDGSQMIIEGIAMRVEAASVTTDEVFVFPIPK